jgi:hypothetical protein
MKTHILLALIMTTITVLHMHAMDEIMILNAKNYVMRNTGSPFSSQNKKQYENQIFPDDIWDQIIAQISPQDRANVKGTCKQLSILTSIDRLDKFIRYDFNIGDDKDRSTLFAAIIQTSKPELITAIMQHAHTEVQSWHSHRDYICINIDVQEAIQKEHMQRYATQLMQEALKQDNAIMIKALEKEDYDHDSIDIAKGAIAYKKELKAKDTRCNCIAAWSITGLCGVLCFVIYATSVAAKYGNYSYSPITIPPLSFS